MLLSISLISSPAAEEMDQQNLAQTIQELKQKLASQEDEYKKKEKAFQDIEKELNLQVGNLEKEVSVLETKAQVQAKIRVGNNNIEQGLDRLKNFCKKYSTMKYGGDRARVLFETSKGNIVIETAPYDVMPYVTYWFLSLAEVGFWDTCGIIRNAAHVLQCNCNGRTKKVPQVGGVSLAFQEYNPDFKHEQWTLGVAGRPGGPDFYFNIVPNIQAHGPGGQGGTEADPCFALVIKGHSLISNIHNELPKPNPDGFLEPKDYFEFKKVRVLATKEWATFS